MSPHYLFPFTYPSTAMKKCRLITPTPTEAQVLGQLVFTFGKYTGKNFKWLVENDVGYCK